MERAASELADMSSGRAVSWRSTEYRAAAARSPHLFLPASQVAFEAAGSGERRRQCLLRDLLDYARAEVLIPAAEAGGGAGLPTLEACATDLWIASRRATGSRETASSSRREAKGREAKGREARREARLAWMDLSAGPFSWGPSVGGRGVRAADSLPRVGKPRDGHAPSAGSALFSFALTHPDLFFLSFFVFPSS